MELHKLFEIKRKQLNLNQDWFAERLNTTQPSISRAEKGKADSTLNQCIGLLLKEFPDQVESTDFYPDYDPKRLDIVEERLKELEKDIKSIIEEMKKNSNKLDDLIKS